MPDCRIGAVIMKMISRTRTTSMNGTMLISDSDVPVSRCIWGMVFFLPEHVNRQLQQQPLRTVDRFNFCDEFRRETIHARTDAANAAEIIVVGDHRGYGCK